MKPEMNNDKRDTDTENKRIECHKTSKLNRSTKYEDNRKQTLSGSEEVLKVIEVITDTSDKSDTEILRDLVRNSDNNNKQNTEEIMTGFKTIAEQINTINLNLVSKKYQQDNDIVQTNKKDTMTKSEVMRLIKIINND